MHARPPVGSSSPLFCLLRAFFPRLFFLNPIVSAGSIHIQNIDSEGEKGWKGEGEGGEKEVETAFFLHSQKFEFHPLCFQPPIRTAPPFLVSPHNPHRAEAASFPFLPSPPSPTSTPVACSTPTVPPPPPLEGGGEGGAVMGSGSRSGFISLALGRGPSSSSFLSVLPGERREKEEEKEGSPSQPLKSSRDSLAPPPWE